MDATALILAVEIVVAPLVVHGAVAAWNAVNGPVGPRVIVVAPAEACEKGLAPAERPGVLCGEER